MAKNKDVFIEIKSIKEICFSQSNVEATSTLGKELGFSFGFSFDVNKENNTIDIMVGVRCGHLGKIVLECKYSISFLIDGFDQVISINKKDGTFKAEDGFVPMLLGVGYGTLRGIVAVKTAGTPLNNYPIPIVNPSEIAENAKFYKDTE